MKSTSSLLFALSGLSLESPIATAKEGGMIGFPADSPGRVRAMTMNVYVGTDLFRASRLLTDPNDPCLLSHGGNPLAALPCAASEIWANFLFTDFPSRAKVLVDHIERAKPDVLGLQEILTAYTGPFNPAVQPTEPQADEIFQDYMQILQDELRSRSLVYEVAGECTTSDLELPAYNDPHNATSGGFNGRFTTKTVLLVNIDTTSYANSASLVFAKNPTIPFPIFYCAAIADVKVREEKSSYQAVSAHFVTSDNPQMQHDQANELVNYLSAMNFPKIIMADLNADPGYDLEVATAYEVLMGAGYRDLWLENENEGASAEGLTWGHNGTLTNEEEEFTVRIDYVMYKDGGTVGTKMAWVDTLGDDPDDSKTANGLWGSDHAAVFADLVRMTTDESTAPPTGEDGGATLAPSGSPKTAPSAGHMSFVCGAPTRFVAVFVCATLGLMLL